MKVYLVDGTYELFRYHFGQPSRASVEGTEVGATAGVLASLISMLETDCRYLGVATDHTVESFRNSLFPGYKTSEGMDQDLLAQFPLLERAIESLGIRVWAMSEYEADDALASASALLERDRRVEQVIICSPDKDLAQCVWGSRVIQRNRRTETDSDESRIIEHFGVSPESIPDWLALVGDSADGFPGLKGWGKKSASLVLAHYRHLEAIPARASDWEESVRSAVRGGEALANRLESEMELALAFRDLATLRLDFPAFDDVEELCWGVPGAEFVEICTYLGVPRLIERISRLSPQDES